MRGGALRGYLTVSLFLAVSPAAALTPHDKSPGVQAKQEAHGSVHAEAEAQSDKQPFGDATSFVSPAQPSGEHGNAEKHGTGGEKEGTEFWPTLVGYKFKITDSLIALSTLALTVFTGMLWRSTEKLWTAGERQIALVRESNKFSRLALESVETPYLVPIVRAFDRNVDPPPPSPTQEGIASYTFKNCGRSPATILERYHFTTAVVGMPSIVPFPPPQSNLFMSEIVAQGEAAQVWRFTAGSFGDWTPADQTRPAWIVGQVRYSDVFENQFVTEFCFYRNAYNGNWHAVGGPHHNRRRQLTKDEMILAEARDRLPAVYNRKT